jgi:hypothetical protein
MWGRIDLGCAASMPPSTHPERAAAPRELLALGLLIPV